MIIFKIFPERSDDLLKLDASLSYGWFAIIGKDFEVSLFKERKCMIFLSLSILLDNLSNRKKYDFKWVGDGNGKTFYFKIKGKEVEIKDDCFTIKLSIEEFRKAVFESSRQFHRNVVSNNPNIVSESVFDNFNHSILALS